MKQDRIGIHRWQFAVDSSIARRRLSFLLVGLLAFALTGCPKPPPPTPPLPPVPLRTEPLPVQQAKAYPETATGRFVSLVDFEDAPQGKPGRSQLEYFKVEPADKNASLKFVYNITRTGAGAMEVSLPPGRQLVFQVPYFHDFRKHTLISFALYSPALRDDLEVTLKSARGSWTSSRSLVVPGWNTVLIDIQQLAGVSDFDVSSVQAIRFSFADALSPVTFNLDDIMLVDNERAITPECPGLKVVKRGLDYSIALGQEKDPLKLAQDREGLWRTSRLAPAVQLFGPGQLPDDSREHLDLMGPRRVGQVTLLEHNALRVRLANVWYFPARSGEWASLAVRQVRWEYTFYPDGRWVTCMEINNSGGNQVELVRALLPEPAAMAGRTISKELAAYGLGSDVGRWSYLAAAGPDKTTHEKAYLNPGKIVPLLTGQGFAPGDSDRDRFDESQGCYYLTARSGHCRFRIEPPPGGLVNPVFRVAVPGVDQKPGSWIPPVSVNMEGQVLREVCIEADSVLFRIPGRIDRPTMVEVRGGQQDADLPGLAPR